MSIPIRAVIFDYGNVLSGPPAPEDLQAMADVLVVEVEPFVALCWRLRLPYDKGEVTPALYWSTVAGQCSRAVSPAQIERLIELDNRSWDHPNPALVDWARRVREAGLRTALLSNMPAPMRDYVNCCCPWMPEFDHRTFSCDVRSAKPSLGIYAHCLEGLGVSPGEALFLDDREVNTRAAEEIGIHAIVFTNAEEAGCEIERRFTLPVPLRS